MNPIQPKPPKLPIKPFPPLPPLPPVNINLVNPGEGAEIHDNTVVFEWENAADFSAGFGGYEVVIDSYDGGNWVSIVVENTGDCKTTTAELSDGLYRWGVQVYQNGNVTGWSDVRYFSIDTVPGLAGDITVSTTTDAATISWKTDKPAIGLLEYGPQSAFESTVGEASFTTDHSITITGLSPATRYSVRIRSLGKNGIENILSLVEFTTRPEVSPALTYTKMPGEKVSLIRNTEVTINVSHPVISKLVLVSGENLYDVNFYIEESALPLGPDYVQISQYDIRIRSGVAGFVEFRVGTEWLERQDIEEVCLIHYVNGSWVRLNTDLVKVDGPYVYCSAYTESFSPFAIVGTVVAPNNGPTLGGNVSASVASVESPRDETAAMLVTIGGSGAIVILIVELLRPYLIRPRRKEKHPKTA
ncbi:MAG: PGF-pre-PGF domain-containing protein [Candidatus Hadarchaeum sp.]|uniref:PGF-pre-PGF domain-containing protein n=1 Tax=Candidatus Hadarchaeum sp. TaxID=2883567 RepID=UPI003D10E9DB